ncbi:MAG: nucleotide exchange factor GrpE [Isosphaeraceae bacterium]|nr:nucleotide exchange factor GrpE [Isosphaeraceae bacterium]
MSEERPPELELDAEDSDSTSPQAGLEPEVALITPAAAYEAIATAVAIAAPAAPATEGQAAPPLPSAVEILGAIRQLGSALERRLEGLQAQFDREIRAEATREKVVDRLHAELQEYKQDLLLKVLRPVFVDLIQLHDDIGKIAAAQPEEDDEGSRLRTALTNIQQGIEDILYRQGVEPYVEPGPLFDPRRQRAVATVPTDDPALAKTVAIRHRKGFQAGERVIRPEIVSVYAPKT